MGSWLRNRPGSRCRPRCQASIPLSPQRFHTGHPQEAAQPFAKRSLSFSFLFLSPFLLFRFSKNTLLQELENTQKQIEEHQHDKVNAAAGSLP